MSGAIMPDPLAMPAMVTVSPPISTIRLAPLGKVSVVMMARAAASMPVSSSVPTRLSMTVSMRSCGRRSPMTPVDDVKTRLSGTPAAAEAAWQRAATLSSPARPVKALALPELTRNAAPSGAAPPRRPGPSFASQSSTGAARVFERVNTPATAVAKRTPFTTGRFGNAAGAIGETGRDFAILLRNQRWIVQHRRIQRIARVTVDLARFGEVRDNGVDRGTLDFLGELCADRIEGRRFGNAGLVQLDHMPAELRLDRFGNRARLERNGGLLEGGNHGAGAKPAEVAAVGAGWPGRAFLSKGREVGATFKLLDDCQRFLLGFHENVARVVFGVRLCGGELRFVCRLERRVGYCAFGDGPDRLVGEDRACFVVDRDLTAG